ncbi:MAG TPA: serine hydrolase, partial [Longimicrobiales bacterium]|nr:serine hydrolase [Longimicrobiales bacterium]
MRAAPRVVLLVLVLAACAPDDGRPGTDEAGDAASPETVEIRRHPLVLDPDRPRTRGLEDALLRRALAAADSLPRLRCLLVARHGETLVERCADGYQPSGYANIKSASKSVLSALVGVAIAEGHLEGVDQHVVPLLEDRLEREPDPLKARITIGHLLGMQSGLARTSGRNYGAWVSSGDWVADALNRPMVAEPGGRMLYSTGNTHLLSAILTRVTGRSTLAYARAVLGEPLGIRIPAWLADPQGIYFGGNDMRLSPRAMLRF